MLTATVPPEHGQERESGRGIAGLLDAAPAAGPEAPCQSNNPDLWFAESPADLERAKALCAGCPLRAQCLAGAVARQEPWGVWGGEIFERGSIVARKRPRGRPRKDTTRYPEIPAARAGRGRQEAAA
jgi:WhiB family redox-sensing transcriptional regulator